MSAVTDSFGVRSVLSVGDRDYEIFRLDRLEAEFGVSRLPYSLKVLLENLVRHEGSPLVVADDVAASEVQSFLTEKHPG